MKKIWFLLFAIISLAELISIVFDYQFLHQLSKPLILPLLIGYFLTSVSARNIYFLGALVFCWTGDVLLMFQNEELFFVFGLVAFLIGHVFYMMSYRNLRYNSMARGLLSTQKIRYALPIVLAGTGLVTILFPHLNGLKIPVMIYSFALTIMVLQAMFRYGFTSTKSFVMVFTGALIFMISDSLLAINKFMQPLPFASLAIMVTYILAQYLIVEGVIHHHRDNPG